MTTSFSKDELISRAIAGALWLGSIITQKGTFKYRIAKNGDEIPARYNMLRHCGCIWTIRELFDAFPEKGNRICHMWENVDRAAEYAKNQLEKPMDQGLQGIHLVDGVWYKLGGNALALLALGGKYLTPEMERELILGIKQFIIGGQPMLLKSKYGRLSQKFSKFQSEYYPGEAALALAKYGGMDEAYRLIRYCRNQRDNINFPGVLPLQDHWAMQAIQEFTMSPLGGGVLAITQYANAIKSTIIQNPGPYWGRPTAMACRSEALIAYYRLMRSKGKPASELMEIQVNIEKLLTEQIKWQEWEKPSMIGCFYNEKGYAQIDDTQHNISSIFKYAKYVI